MDYTVIIILQIVNLIFLGFALFFKSYLGEKGKNAASKDDVQHLTELVEGVKLIHSSEIERFKSSLQNEFQIIERRRRVYEEICNAMRVFINGNDAAPEAKERFLMAYSAAWLWASDAVLISLNLFVDLQLNTQKIQAPTMDLSLSALIGKLYRQCGRMLVLMLTKAMLVNTNSYISKSEMGFSQAGWGMLSRPKRFV
jgi:hypothetical protein